jgi:hypothetical protein
VSQIRPDFGPRPRRRQILYHLPSTFNLDQWYLLTSPGGIIPREAMKILSMADPNRTAWSIKAEATEAAAPESIFDVTVAPLDGEISASSARHPLLTPPFQSCIALESYSCKCKVRRTAVFKEAHSFILWSFCCSVNCSPRASPFITYEF